MEFHDRDELTSKLGDRELVISVSGGKDSTAMALYLTRDLGIKGARFVFADTGWEHPDTYTYIKEVLAPLFGHIEWVGYPGGMKALVKARGMFPNRLRRFCTEELKLKPIIKYVATLQDQGVAPVVAVGIRRAESEARSKMPEWEWSDSYDAELFRPLVLWTEQDVIDTHTRHGVRPNPLYIRGQGVARVGCWPCIFSRKAEIRMIADSTPEVIDTIRKMEAEVDAAVRAKIAARGEKVEGTLPTFFHGGHGYTKIDDAVAWSRTKHGGKIPELFVPEREQGCVRWGLCEAVQKDHLEAQVSAPSESPPPSKAALKLAKMRSRLAAK